jgi:hypothetical protein
MALAVHNSPPSLLLIIFVLTYIKRSSNDTGVFTKSVDLGDRYIGMLSESIDDAVFTFDSMSGFGQKSTWWFLAQDVLLLAAEERVFSLIAPTPTPTDLLSVFQQIGRVAYDHRVHKGKRINHRTDKRGAYFDQKRIERLSRES